MTDSKNHTVRVDGGKYEFIHRVPRATWVAVYHYGSPISPGSDEHGNAIASMMAELDAARVVVAAVRANIQKLEGKDVYPAWAVDALALHDRLCDDREPPSEWAQPADTKTGPQPDVDQSIEATISRCAAGHDAYAVMLNDFRLFGGKCCGRWTVVRRYKTTLAELRDDLGEAVPELNSGLATQR